MFFLYFILVASLMAIDPSCRVVYICEDRVPKYINRQQINNNYVNYNNATAAYLRRVQAEYRARQLRAIREYNLMIRRYNNQLLQNRIIQIPRRRCPNN
jgi:hypothetical protein